MSGKSKNYRVIVNGQREEKILSVVEPVVYYLPAENKEKAIIAAKKKFGNEHPGVIEVKAAINKKQSIVAIICLAFACLLSLFPWYFPGGSMISLKPTLIPMLFSVAIYSAVIIRIKGLKNSFNSVSETLCSVLTIVFVASFLSLLSGDANIEILGFTLPISGKPLLIFAALLSWLGMAKVAKFVWIALFILAAFRLLAADSAMGIWGMVYVLLGFLGIVFQLKQENDSFLKTLSHDFITSTAKARAIVKIEK